MRKRSERDLGTLIRDLGGDWKKFEDKRFCPHCKKMLYRVDNRGYDGIATLKGRAIPIEVKSGKRSLRFADLEDHQREALQAWQDKHGWPAWVAIQVGEGRPNQKIEDIPLKFWLFPYNFFLALELLCLERANQKSIPYSSKTTNNSNMIMLDLTLVEGCDEYEIVWIAGRWTMPTWHLFRLNYINHTYHEREERNNVRPERATLATI